MELLEENIHIVKMLLNPETHHLALMLEKELSLKLKKNISSSVNMYRCEDVFSLEESEMIYILLKYSSYNNILLDNNALNLSKLNGEDFLSILKESNIGLKLIKTEKVPINSYSNSIRATILSQINKPFLDIIVDLYSVKTNDFTSEQIAAVLTRSQISEKLFDDNMLNLNNLKSFDISYILRISDFPTKILSSGKLNLNKLEKYDIETIVKYSHIDSTILKKYIDY